MGKAKETLALLEEAIFLDQGSAYRGFLRQEVLNLSDAFRTEPETYRRHMGASVIGRECPREVWYSFRWATAKKHTGRLMRLFNRGHLEEARFIAILRAAKIEVWSQTPDFKQFKISDESGHFGGSLDAVCRGIPELGPDMPALTEFKTHGEKSFAKLEASGVLTAKWEHYVQMQIYMGKMKLAFALYLAVNKNDDTLYAEIVPFDPAVYQRYLDRATQLIFSLTPPKRINESSSWFACKMCDHNAVCFKKVLPSRTCRSCFSICPSEQGTWLCLTQKSKNLSEAEQALACGDYALHPEFQR